VNGVAIVHYHFFHYTNLEALCVMLARAYGFKIVITVHDVVSFSGPRNIARGKRILAGADKIIAHNEESKNELISMVSVPPSSISIIPHGNYIESIAELPDKNRVRNKAGLSTGNPVILFFGQIKKVKGLDILLHALPEVIKKFSNLKLVIAGKVWKDDFSTYEKIIYDHGLAGNVITHIHYILDEDVVNHFGTADLVVLPYRKNYQSGVLLMAMSFKVPVLVSDIPVMTKIITDGENGYVFESGNTASLSSKLISIFSDTRQMATLGAAGYELVATDFDWNKIGQSTAELYDGLSCS